MPSMCRAKTAPITPYWSRCRGLGKTLAPTSMMTQRPLAVGMTVAMPGRWTHLRNRRGCSPPATTAPVLPAETRPSTFLAARSCQQRTMELSGFVRSASTGFSFMLDDLGAWNDLDAGRPAGRRPPGAGRAGPGRRRGRRSGRGRRRGPGPRRPTFGAGPWSPPIASRAIRMGHFPCFSSASIGDRVAALVVAAVRADAVRQHRLVAPRAVLDLHRRRRGGGSAACPSWNGRCAFWVRP